MLPYKESTIVEHTVANALSRCTRVILVTGYRGPELEQLYRKAERVIPVRNAEFHRGMFSSIQTGVPLIKSSCFFITMGDMPEIGETLYDALLNTMTANPAVDIVRPLFNGKRGHPVLLKKSVIPTILSEPENSEMKHVFTRHSVLDLDMNIPETFMDIDTEEDYRKAAGTE